jgi:hypothetical protein
MGRPLNVAMSKDDSRRCARESAGRGGRSANWWQRAALTAAHDHQVPDVDDAVAVEIVLGNLRRRERAYM